MMNTKETIRNREENKKILWKEQLNKDTKEYNRGNCRKKVEKKRNQNKKENTKDKKKGDKKNSHKETANKNTPIAHINTSTHENKSSSIISSSEMATSLAIFSSSSRRGV